MQQLKRGNQMESIMASFEESSLSSFFLGGLTLYDVNSNYYH
jgi:hypothetical protein